MVAIDSGPARDLYLVLTELTPTGTARLSVFVNPLVLWLWVAGAIIAARRPGGRLARPAVGAPRAGRRAAAAEGARGGARA